MRGQLSKINTQPHTRIANAVPWCLAHRDSFSAKAPGFVTDGLPTNAFCSYPLAVMLKRQQFTRQLLPGQLTPKHNFEEYNSDRLDNTYGFCFATYIVHLDK